MRPVQHKPIADGFSNQQMIVLPRPVVKEALSKPITSGLLPTDIGLFPSAASHYIDRRLGVSQAILIYCLRGDGWAEVGGSRCSVKEEEVLIVPPDHPHSYGASEQRPWTIYWCHVGGTNVRHLLDALGVRSGGPTVLSGDSRTLVPLFEKLISTLAVGYSRPSLLVASLTMGQLFGQLIGLRGTGPTVGDIDDRLGATIEFMKQNIRGVVRINELAAMARLSPSHYSLLFKRRTGYSVLNYFIRLKMQEACRLLDMTALPVKSVARQVGYDDALFFSRAFHKVMALPPRQYRASRKG